jgi:hypothetical protein
MLTNAIYSYIDMTHGQILKHRTSDANQCSPFPDKKARHRCRGGCRDDGSIRNFQAPGIPLCPRSPKGRNQHSNSRTQDCLYYQVISETDSSNTRPCKSVRTEFERNRYPGLRKISLQRPEAWLKDLNNKLSWIFVLTGYRPKSLLWHINF